MSLTRDEPEHAQETALEEDAHSGDLLRSARLYPEFRIFLFGMLAADTAFWMYQVAIGWLALQLTDSPFFVGVVGFTGGIPLLLVSLPAGVIIDRFDRRKVLLIGQMGLLLIALTFALLVGTGVISRVSVLMLVIAYGSIISFVMPTRSAMIPSLIERHELANGVALSAAAHNATRVVGPSFAGAMIGIFGLAETFAAAAISMVVAMVMTTRLPSLTPQMSTSSTGMAASLTMGLRVVAQRSYLLALIVLALAPTVLVMPYINLMPVFARDQLGLGSTGLGVLLASTGLGTVAGSLVVARGSRSLVNSRSQVITAIAFAACVLAFSITPVVVGAVLLLFVAGALSAAFFAMNQSALQLGVEDDVRGRVLSVHMLTWGVLPFGQLLVGANAGRIGTPMAMAISCLIAILCVALIVYRFPALRDRRVRDHQADSLKKASRRKVT